MLKKLAKEFQIQDYVTFMNFIPLERMPDFYSSADIFCLPSLHEGFPLSIAESLSIGLIIVASAIEGIPEAIIENKNGYLVKPGNVSDLSDKLVKALTLNDDKVDEIRNNNIKLSKEKYSWQIIVREILKVYKEDN